MFCHFPGTASDRTPLATTPVAPKGAVVDLNHLDRVNVPETVRETAEEGPPVVPPPVEESNVGDCTAEEGPAVEGVASERAAEEGVASARDEEGGGEREGERGGEGSGERGDDETTVERQETEETGDAETGGDTEQQVRRLWEIDGDGRRETETKQRHLRRQTGTLGDLRRHGD